MRSYTSEATSQVPSFAYPNGVQHAFGYDRVTSLNVADSLRPLASYTQTIYRLTQENISGDPVSANNGVLNYFLDPVGNRLSLTSTLAALGNQSFTYDADDRLGGDTYDANGNTLSSGGNAFRYEFEDRLVNFNSGAVQMVYDSDGNRVVRRASGVTTRFLVDEQTPTGYAEVVGGSVVAQYTYGLAPSRGLAEAKEIQVNYEFRELDARERDLLGRLLGAVAHGRDELRTQLNHVEAQQIQDDGTLRLRCNGGTGAPGKFAPVAEARYKDADGADVSLILHLGKGGFMSMLEIIRYDGSRIINPPLAQNLVLLLPEDPG